MRSKKLEIRGTERIRKSVGDRERESKSVKEEEKERERKRERERKIDR